MPYSDHDEKLPQSACVECHVQLARGLSPCAMHRVHGRVASASRVFVETFGPIEKEKTPIEFAIDQIKRKGFNF